MWALRPLLFCLFIFLSSLSAASRAEAEAAADDDSAAHAAFEAGADAYDEGRFGAALVAYQRAYELSGRAKLLFNIGRAADGDNQSERAIEAYRGYLLAFPNAANRRFVESRIGKLQAAVAAARVDPKATRDDLSTPATQQLLLRRQELQRTLLHGSGLGLALPIALLAVGAVEALISIPLLKVGLHQDYPRYGEVDPKQMELVIPGAILLGGGLATALAGAIMIPVRRAKRKRLNEELLQINRELGAPGPVASFRPLLPAVPGGPAGLQLRVVF